MQLTLGEPEQVVILKGAWEAALVELKEQVNSATYERWIRTLTPVGRTGSSISLATNGEFARQWITRKFADSLAASLSSALGEPVTVQIVLDERAKTEQAPPPPVAKKKAAGPEPAIRRPSFIQKYTFDRFVEGNSNRLALAGAQAVAAQPGKKFNPLFIYGGPGLGKTHLLHAIGQHVVARDACSRIVYLTGQVFAEEFIHSVKTGRVGQFRSMQRSVDIWLVDDVQLIAGKERTQEELFHTFNFLYEGGRQIVICSDRPPRELYLMEERLRSRFESGLVADISPPDFETRAAILIKKAEEEGVTLPMDVVDLMADRIQSNIRKLEGSLCRLLAEASLAGCPPTVEMAAKVLHNFFEDANAAKPSPEAIIEASAECHGVTVDEVMGKGRKQAVTGARQVAMYLCREIWSLPWKQIGTLFRKDHSSAIYAHKSIGEELVRNPDLQRVLDEIVEAARSKRQG
ncbi:MAG: chromosomal replication initiator protein DnaA [Fimbriimonadales bacterium]